MKIKTLVDTSVWISHFNAPNQRLIALLNSEKVVCHPMILGELACGSLRGNVPTMADLLELERVFIPTFEEVLSMIQSLQLYSRGIGWTDVNLVASSLLSEVNLFTLDKRLIAVAGELDLLLP
jgi:predicted nucleic acid-binding protein